MIESNFLIEMSAYSFALHESVGKKNYYKKQYQEHTYMYIGINPSHSKYIDSCAYSGGGAPQKYE